MQKNIKISKYQKYIDKFSTSVKIDYPHLSTILQKRLDVPEHINGSLVVPISLGSKYSQTPPGTTINGHFYDRYSNPTTSVLNDIMARLDFAKYAHSTSSGMAAFTAIMQLFQKGDQVIISDDTYTGTKKCLNKLYKPFGIDSVQTNFSDLEKIERCITPNTKAILLETPTNPTMKVYDIQEISKICKKNNLLFIVDNTTAMQISTNPLQLGADIVWYSASKFLGGHGDAMSGTVVTNNKDISSVIYDRLGTSGWIISPFTSFLVLRGLHTFKLRMQQHLQNSYIIADFLKQHKNIEAVYFTGSEDNPYKQIIDKQMRVPAAILCFKVKGDLNHIEKFNSSFNTIKFTESFGSTKTTLNYSCKQTHRFATEEEKQLEGITENFFRLSPGLEEPEDILEELDIALNSINK